MASSTFPEGTSSVLRFINVNMKKPEPVSITFDEVRNIMHLVAEDCDGIETQEQFWARVVEVLIPNSDTLVRDQLVKLFKEKLGHEVLIALPEVDHDVDFEVGLTEEPIIVMNSDPLEEQSDERSNGVQKELAQCSSSDSEFILCKLCKEEYQITGVDIKNITAFYCTNCTPKSRHLVKVCKRLKTNDVCSNLEASQSSEMIEPNIEYNISYPYLIVQQESKDGEEEENSTDNFCGTENCEDESIEHRVSDSDHSQEEDQHIETTPAEIILKRECDSTSIPMSAGVKVVVPVAVGKLLEQSCNEDLDIRRWTLYFTHEEFQSVVKDYQMVSNWCDTIAAKVNGEITDSCPVKFINRHVKKAQSRKRNTPFFSARADCMYPSCGIKFYYHIWQDPLETEGLIKMDVACYGNKCHDSERVYSREKIRKNRRITPQSNVEYVVLTDVCEEIEEEVIPPASCTVQFVNFEYVDGKVVNVESVDNSCSTRKWVFTLPRDQFCNIVRDNNFVRYWSDYLADKLYDENVNRSCVPVFFSRHVRKPNSRKKNSPFLIAVARCRFPSCKVVFRFVVPEAPKDEESSVDIYLECTGTFLHRPGEQYARHIRRPKRELIMRELVQLTPSAYREKQLEKLRESDSNPWNITPAKKLCVYQKIASDMNKISPDARKTRRKKETTDELVEDESVKEEYSQEL